MADSDDFQALENISNEVDNSQVKILISSHCMKAQIFLLEKLRKQAERQKEICKFISSSNLKLETEIKLAEQEVKSLNIAIETIKLGNIELNKEQLLSKERKAEIFERTKIGKEKYEKLWLASKARYENIPIVRKLIEAKNKNQTVQANINTYINESKHLENQIKIKKDTIAATDRARVIDLAEYLVRERAKMLTKINEYNVNIKEVLYDIENFNKDESRNNRDGQIPADKKEAVESIEDSLKEDNWCDISKNSEKDPMALPKLHLQNSDLDIFSLNIDQINKVDSQNITSIKRSSSTLSSLEENPHKIHKSEDMKMKNDENYISSYFDLSLNDNAEKCDTKQYNKNYSEKKLIHILEDIKLDKNETLKIIKNLEVKQFQTIECITSNKIEEYENISNTQHEINKGTPDQEMISLEREGLDIKLAKSREEDVVDPPSQFIDVSQSSQEKKAVSFNIPADTVTLTSPQEVIGSPKEIDKSQEKMLNSSAASDDSYAAIKDKILKKHNLDLSPQFVYSKSTLMHKHQEEKITSKFFESQKELTALNFNNDDYNKNLEENQNSKYDKNKSSTYENEICPEKENVVASSPKGEITNMEMPVEGLLFNHGAQGISDSMNLSISTTGLEDNEDFPHCIDSSLLLSPKADIPASVSSSHTNEVLSQEVPNFLTGFRKSALSFFGSTNPSDARVDSGETQGGGFNFAFGNEEKKGRGGFFSMFH